MTSYSRMTMNRGQTTNGQISGTYRNGQNSQSPFQISQQNGGGSSSMNSPYSIASTGFQIGQSQNSGGGSSRPTFNTAHTVQSQYAAGNGMTGRPVSPYSVAQNGPSPYGGGGNGDGRPVSPFSAAQNQHSGMQTPGQMFSSVLRPGNSMPLGPAAGMGNNAGIANPSSASQNQGQSTDSSVVFGNTDEVQFINGQIIIPKSWALNHLAKEIQKQQELEKLSPGDGSFGCPEFAPKCPKKYTFLDNNGCPVCSYMPTENAHPQPSQPGPLPDVCMLSPIAKGPCNTYAKRYAFDSRARRCLMFVERACGDLRNRFDTMEECQYVCGKHYQAPEKKENWYDNIWNKRK